MEAQNQTSVEPSLPRKGMPRSIRVMLNLIFALISITVVFYGIAVLSVFLTTDPDRSRISYFRLVNRDLQMQLTDYHAKTGKLPPGGEYFGPWDEKLHAELTEGLSGIISANPRFKYDEIIDPYNDDPSFGGLRGGFRFNVDRGTAVIEGASPLYYTDGKTITFFASKGPDRDWDITREDVESYFDDSELDQDYSKYHGLSYDPTNGTVSGGDLIWAGKIP